MRRVFRIPFARGHIAREVDDELSFHLEMRAQRLIAAGWTPDAARREALRQFGDVDSVKQDCVTMDEQRERAMHRANVIGELQQDVVYALRTLRRNFGFTAVIVSALALGIGANTAIFTLIDATMMRTLPVPHPEQLVAVGDPTSTEAIWSGSARADIVSYLLYKDLRDHNQIFTGLLASGHAPRLDMQVDGSRADLEHPHGRFVSANYFHVLGVGAGAGRLFDSHEDDVAGSAPVAVISDGYWARRFDRDRSVIGRAVTIDGVKITIIGVAPPSFSGDVVGASTDMWLPITMHDVLRPNERILDGRATSWLLMLGRLKPGATLEQAREQVPMLIKREVVASSSPADAKAFIAATSKYYVSDGSKGFSRVRTEFHAPLLTLMTGVALLLCIICANVANLLLARAIARGREMSVRLALGADRSRIVRQLLTESAVLAVLSAATGLLVAWWGSRTLLAIASGSSSIHLSLSPDVRVLAFTLVVSIGAVALFGLVPALRAARGDVATMMRSGSGAVTGAPLGLRTNRVPLGTLLVVGQVALSVLLLVAAGMLVRSLRKIDSTDIGIDRDHLIIVDVDATSGGYTGARIGPFANRLRDRLAAVPGVAAVTLSENGVFSGTESDATIEVPGFEMRQPSDSLIAYDQVGADYAHALGAHLIAGRDIARGDEGVSPRVVVVNQSLARFYFGDTAVGRFLYFNDSIAVQIVGVVANIRDHHLEGTLTRRAYFPFVHAEDKQGLGWPSFLRLEVRAVGDPARLVQPLRDAVRSIDPMLPIDGIDPLPVLMRETIAQERLLAKLATAFGILALLLAAIGLYGVMTYAITRRTSEIGLRVALGAQRGDIVRMVLRDGLGVVVIGVVVGLPVTLASVRLLGTQLHNVPLADPVSIAAAIAVLMTSALVAALLPALRASRVSPIVALRAE